MMNKLKYFFFTYICGEILIAQNSYKSYLFALRNKDRFILGEKAISKDACCSYNYALDIIKGRFPEGEKIISKSILYSYLYSRNIIEGRFIEGEEIILKSSHQFTYKRKFLKNQF